MPDPRLISFDVFDTVLVRLVHHPHIVFAAMAPNAAKLLAGSDLASCWHVERVAAEEYARQKGWNGEVSIFDIYQALREKWSLTEELTDSLMEAELSMEMSYCRVNAEMVDRITAYRESGCRICFTSDMYLPEAFIMQLLQKAGVWHKGDLLLVSNSHSKSKLRGDLFDELCSIAGLQPQQVKHIGDHAQADFLIPSSKGIEAEHYTKCHTNRYESAIALSSYGHNVCLSKLAAALRLARLAPSPATSSREATIRNTAIGATAPVLFGFVYWTIRRAQDLGLKGLLFVARDGYILHKIARQITKRYNLDLEIRYIYGSRQAWHLPSVTVIDEHVLDWAMDRTQYLTLRLVCNRLGLKPEEIADTLLGHGFPDSTWSDQMNDHSISRLQAMLCKAEIADLILERSAKLRQKVQQYLASLQIDDFMQWGFVDIGWRGRLQISLERLLLSCGLLPINMALHGFYFGLHQVDPKDNREAFFILNGKPAARQGMINTAILELMTAAPHGTTLGYNTNDSGVIPILDRANSKALDWGLQTHIDACLDACQSIVDNLDNHELEQINWSAISEAVLPIFINSPSKDEAEVFGAWPVSEDQKEEIYYELAPLLSIGDSIGYLFSGRLPHHNVWFKGALGRSARLSKLVINRRGRKPERWIVSAFWRLRSFVK
jgi:FMN phosphatase YigB (HAD superfamily)